jgi:hypothetical protein
MKWMRELLFILRNAVAIYLILFSTSVIWTGFLETESFKTYGESVEYRQKIGLTTYGFFLKDRADFSQITLPIFSVVLALGLRLFKLEPDK